MVEPHLLVEPWARAHLPGIRARLDAAEVSFTSEVVDSGMETAARDALMDGRSLLFAVGDDGSINGVVNGVMTETGPLVEGLGVGILAAGESGMARTFGLPLDPVAGCRALEGEGFYGFDVGLAETTGAPPRFFAVGAEVGFGARHVALEQRLPSWLGRARTFLGFWGALAASGADVRISAGRRAYSGPAWDVVVGNCQFLRGLRHSPRSFPGDGLLDVLALHGSRSDAFRSLPQMRRGEHVPGPEVAELRGAEVLVGADRNVPVHVDGVPVGTTPARFSVVPQALRLKV